MPAALVALERWMGQALAALSAGQRKALFSAVGREVRQRNAARMAAQIGPDGAPWASRQPRRERDSHGKVRRAARMMLKLRQAKRLRVDASAAGVDVGFRGRNALIASIHHYGGMDYVDRRQSDVKAAYPARPLIGLPADDVQAIRQIILSHIAAKLPG